MGDPERAREGDPQRSRAERFRQVLEDWNERGIEAIENRWHEDVVWEEPAGFPDAGVRRGREEVVRRMRERFAMVGVVTLETVEVEEIGDRLYAEAIVRGRGSTSGVPTEMHSFWVYDYSDDGRVIRWREFLDRDEALAAARGEAASPPVAGS
jgi:ketosteroid isomerase-like protein